MEPRVNRKAVAICIALLVALGLATALALASSGSSSAAPTGTSSADGANTMSVRPDAGQRNPDFEALQPATEEAIGDLPPQGAEWLTMVQRLPQPRASITEFAPEETATVSEIGSGPTAGGGTAVLAEVGDLICAVQLEPEARVPGTSACGEAELAAAGRAFTATPAGCDAYRLWGIMPSGVEVLSISSAAGQMQVPVSSNVYEAELEPVATVVSGRFESGEAFDVHVPLNKYAAMDEGC